jgi:hypothetical protein
MAGHHGDTAAVVREQRSLPANLGEALSRWLDLYTGNIDELRYETWVAAQERCKSGLT